MYVQPTDRRSIISRRSVNAAFAALSDDLEIAARRQAVLAILRPALIQGREELKRRFFAGGSGPDYAHGHSFLIDQILRLLFDDATERLFPAPNPTLSERMAIVAVGGYGRGEMAPFSDVDILFLQPYKPSPRTEQVAEYMLYVLWDLGLKVGHATRSIDDCLRRARDDTTIGTALLESRYVWGDQDLYAELRRRFVIEVSAMVGVKYVEAKLTERDQRHARMGDSRYMLEPNLKDGKGGLRDLHTLFWIAKWLYRADTVEEITDRGVLTRAEAARFSKAEQFLWTVRCHLHLLANRAEERITFDVQAELARRMGYTDHAGMYGVERVMKHYFLVAKDVGDLTRIFCAAIEAQHQRKPRRKLKDLLSGPKPKRRDLGAFHIDGERLTHTDEAAFLADPVNFIRLFWLADREGLDIHPATLRLLTQNLRKVNAELRADPEANALFLEILTSRNDPEGGLRRMSESGVFGRFVPDFGRVVAMMQFDMYHTYTVDEHSIFAIGILARIERGDLADMLPLPTQLIKKIQSRRALYVALLLHDIAKGRGGDHSELGEQVAIKLGPRFGLSEEETETAAWLVRHHLLLSDTAFKRDLGDPKTIDDVIEIVQSPERLRLLLILTCADIRAVGPKVWNSWKGALLTELFHGCAERLAAEVATDAELTAARTGRLQKLWEDLRAILPDFTDAEFDEHWQRGSSAYFLSSDIGSLARQARLVRRADRDGLPLEIEHRIDIKRGITEVTVCALDHPGLFAQVAGAIAVAGATIVDARIFTLNNGLAIDTFTIQDAQDGAFARPEQLARLAVQIEHALDGKLRMREQLAKRPGPPPRTRALRVTPRVLIDNGASGTNTVIELNGRDRPGLLYELTAALTNMALQINHAKIATYGMRVVDVFYVKDVFGHKIENETKLAAIRTRLLAILADPDPEPARAAAE